MKVTPLCLLVVLHTSCCLAFVSHSPGNSKRRLPPASFPMIEATSSTSSILRSRLTQVSLASSPLEATSTLLSLDVSSSLQIFYTATLVAGVGYSQRMAGRQDFKREMATKIANGLITPEELVDEITVMAEEINKEISESKSLAEAAQMEVQNLLDEMRAMQEQLQQIPDALNIERAALAIVEEEAPTVKAATQEKVLVAAGGAKEKVSAGGRNEDSAIPSGIVEGFGVYDDVFEMEEVEGEEMEWSVPLAANHDDGITKAAIAKESKESTQNKDTADAVKDDGVELVADALQTNATDRDEQIAPALKAEDVVVESVADALQSNVADRDDQIAPALKAEDVVVELVADAIKTNVADRVEQIAPSSDDSTKASRKKVEESTEAIRKQAEDFRARIKQMEARISSDTAGSKQAEAKVTPDPKPSPPAPPAIDVLSPSSTAKQAATKFTPDPKPSPPAPSAIEDRIQPDTTKQEEEVPKPDPKPSPPASEPPVKVPSSVKTTTKPKKVIPDGPIRSSPLARVLCSDFGVELADVYPGTGLNGRIIADDVRNYAKNRGN